MGEAVLFSVIASSALVIGGVLGAYWSPPRQVTGVLLAFASGSLISALCFELFPEAFELGGAWRAGLGLLAGGTAFVIANAALDRRMAGSAKPEQREKVERGAAGLPESLVGAVAMRDEGRPRREAILIWTICALVLAVAVVLGRAAFAGADEGLLAVCLAFAGGAVLASLADTLMPEAFEHGRPFNSFATAAGFFLSFMLATV